MAVQKTPVVEEKPVEKAPPQKEELGVGPSDITARRVQTEATRQKKVVRGE